MFEHINSFLGTFVALALIFVGGMFFVRIRFLHLIFPSCRFKNSDEQGRKSGVSPFRALTLALAGTLGVGNIAGVATAIHLGGFGSIFWMEISAIFAMALKYAETVLAVSHRRCERGGGFFGGALYYINDHFQRLGAHRAGKLVCAVFAVFLFVDSFSTGCIIQANAAATSVRDVLGIPAIVTGIVFAVTVAAVALSGSDKLSRITEILIPLLTVGYVILSFAVMIRERASLPNAFRLIISDAFSTHSAAGGIFGFITSRALRFGTVRGLISNEAGCGTSPTAHASSNAKSPVSQGLWGVFEVFIDTTVLCTLTAIVIVVNYPYVSHLGSDGIMMAIKAYSVSLGEWSEYFLAASVAVFGFATLLCRAHYGREAVRFLAPKKSSVAEKIYVIAFAFTVMLGSCVSSDFVWNAADLSISVLTLINVTILIFMRKEIFSLTDNHLKSKSTENRQNNKKIDARS